MLKLNTNKTEALLIANKHQLATFRNGALHAGDDIVDFTSSARNIGVVFDSTLSMIPQINSSAQSANFHLRNIGRIRKFLNKPATEQLVHSLVTSRLDYGNSLLANTPKCHIHKLQLVQNTAARIVTMTNRFDSITPVLISLHWLPVEAQVKFKVCLLTFKAWKDKSPTYIKEIVKLYVPPRPLRSEKQRLLVDHHIEPRPMVLNRFMLLPLCCVTHSQIMSDCATKLIFVKQKFLTLLFDKLFNFELYPLIYS